MNYTVKIRTLSVIMNPRYSTSMCNPLSAVVNYVVKIHTSDKAGAGTDSNVFCTVWGEKGDSGERQMRKSENVNKFEKAQVSEKIIAS